MQPVTGLTGGQPFDRIDSDQPIQTPKQKIQALVQTIIQGIQTHFNSALNRGKALLTQLKPYAPAIAIGLKVVTFPKVAAFLLIASMVYIQSERKTFAERTISTQT